MIYDGFMFFNEFELLEIRLQELKDVVDYFILVESDMTHSGKKKPLNFREKRHLFKEFESRLIYVEVCDMPATKVTWDREIHQRNCIMRGLMPGAKDDDILIVADVDEIPRAETLRKILPVHRTLALSMSSYGGYLNSPSGEWSHAKIGPVGAFRQMGPQLTRHGQHIPVPYAGWHFSYLGGGAAVSEKMGAFSHQEPGVQKFNNREILEKNLKAGIGVFGGPMAFCKVDETFPLYLRENIDRFKHLIWPV
jgi:beta-1,4-mannosyl-glycoprotein beta-1,4-N-acetylglucosaminyltransferase